MCAFIHSISCVPTSCHDFPCLKSRSCGWCKTCVPSSLLILGNICDSWFTPWRTVVYQKVSVAATSLLGCRWGLFATDGDLNSPLFPCVQNVTQYNTKPCSVNALDCLDLVLQRILRCSGFTVKLGDSVLFCLSLPSDLLNNTFKEFWILN